MARLRNTGSRSNEVASERAEEFCALSFAFVGP
jgi:hypothetical protein